MEEPCPLLQAVGAFDNLVSQGAEAVRTSPCENCGPTAVFHNRYAQRVFRVTFLDNQTIIKQRFAKRYRHPELDSKITRTRLTGVRSANPLLPLLAVAAQGFPLLQEARALLKARKLGVAVPTLFFVDTQSSSLYMEFVPGPSAKQLLFSGLDAAGTPLRPPPRNSIQ